MDSRPDVSLLCVRVIMSYSPTGCHADVMSEKTRGILTRQARPRLKGSVEVWDGVRHSPGASSSESMLEHANLTRRYERTTLSERRRIPSRSV